MAPFELQSQSVGHSFLGRQAREQQRHSRTIASHLVSRSQILQACSFCLCPCQTSRLVRARSPRRIVPPGHLPLLPSSLRHAVSNTPLQLPPPCCCWQTAAYLFLVTSFSFSSRLHILISIYVLFKPPLSCSLSPRSPSYSASAYTHAHARLHQFQESWVNLDYSLHRRGAAHLVCIRFFYWCLLSVLLWPYSVQQLNTLTKKQKGCNTNNSPELLQQSSAQTE